MQNENARDEYTFIEQLNTAMELSSLFRVQPVLTVVCQVMDGFDDLIAIWKRYGFAVEMLDCTRNDHKHFVLRKDDAAVEVIFDIADPMNFPRPMGVPPYIARDN